MDFHRKTSVIIQQCGRSPFWLSQQKLPEGNASYDHCRGDEEIEKYTCIFQHNRQQVVEQLHMWEQIETLPQSCLHSKRHSKMCTWLMA